MNFNAESTSGDKEVKVFVKCCWEIATLRELKMFVVQQQRFAQSSICLWNPEKLSSSGDMD